MIVFSLRIRSAEVSALFSPGAQGGQEKRGGKESAQLSPGRIPSQPGKTGVRGHWEMGEGGGGLVLVGGEGGLGELGREAGGEQRGLRQGRESERGTWEEGVKGRVGRVFFRGMGGGFIV